MLDVPLLLISSPYRSFIVPIFPTWTPCSPQTDSNVTVVLPEYRTPFPWQGWLHNQTSRRLRSALLDCPNTVVVDVPYHLGEQLDLAATRVPQSNGCMKHVSLSSFS